MRLWWNRRFETKLDVEECERRIWLLNGTSIPGKIWKPGEIYVMGHAGPIGFRIWVVATSRFRSRPSYGESALALRGRWIATADGTAAAVWYTPRPWFLQLIVSTIALALGIVAMRMCWVAAFRDLVGNAGLGVYGLPGVAAIVLLWKVRTEMTENRLGQALAKALGEPLDEESPYPMRRPLHRRSRDRRLRRSGNSRG